MLSSLPKLADRTFILGVFLPTLLFAIVVLFLFRDQDMAKKWIEGLSSKDLGNGIYLLFAVWIVAVIVSLLNHLVYRVLEGYILPKWLERRLKAWKCRRLESALKQLAIETPTRSLDWYNLLERMPLQPSQVRPTDFGNAIRSFETYPFDIYGVDSIPIWLRLITVIPKGFLDQINDMRSRVDFWINCWLFSALVVLLSAGRTISYAMTLYYGSGHNASYAFTTSICKFLPWIIGAAIVSWVSYRAAVFSVPAWGSLVKSAFDCYLPALAKQLGFELPTSEPELRLFWVSLGNQLVFRRDLDGKPMFDMGRWKRLSNNPSEDPERGPEVSETEKEDAVDNDSKRTGESDSKE